MAKAPTVQLFFDETHPKGAWHEVDGLPEPLPEVGDDFNFQARDYDGLRMFMLEELAARAPERRRWTAADMEVVLVEAFAAVLDQLSDMADRVAGEAWLETARRPESVRRLLQFIGYDAARVAFADEQIKADPGLDATRAAKELEALWRSEPWLMDKARAEGPRALREQHRMVTLADHVTRLEEHPLVLRASASVAWAGAWPVVRVAVLPWCGCERSIDTREGSRLWGGGRVAPEIDAALRRSVERFHALRDLPMPVWDEQTTTIRDVLVRYVDACRMVGQEVELVDAVPVGIELALVVQVSQGYFQSEVRTAIEQALGKVPGGFFEPGRLVFGQDIFLSDIIAAVTVLDGVESVTVQKFKRFGDRYFDQSEEGRIGLSGMEIAICENDRKRPFRGVFDLELRGGQRG